MAGWTQALGGIVTHNGELVTHNDEPVTYDDGSGWNLLQGTVKTASTGAWDQTASWDALGSLEQIGAAGWEQAPATWDAAGLFAEAVSAEAAFEQSATWAAEGLHAEQEPVTSDAAWVQLSSWDASASHTKEAAPEPPPGISIRPGGLPPLRPVVRMTASFSQSATWHATLEVDRTPVEFEELLLAGVL